MHPVTKEVMKSFSPDDIELFINAIQNLQYLTMQHPDKLVPSTYDFWLDNTAQTLVLFGESFGAKLHKIAKYADQYDNFGDL